MKKTCTLILLLALAFAGRAQNVSVSNNRFGLLSITNLSPQKLGFEVDGKVFPDGTNFIDLNNMRPGPHPVKVYSLVTNGAAITRALLYSNVVNVKPLFYVDIIVNRFGRVLIDEQALTGNQFQNNANQYQYPNPGQYPNSGQYPNGGNPNGGNQYPNNGNNNWNNNPNGGYNNNQGYNNGQGYHNGHGYDNNYPEGNYGYQPRPIDDNTFNSFVETVRRESFDDSRKAIAKVGIDQNFFTSAQAKTLLTIFSFEAAKLEIAKYMYGKIVDPKNFFVVYNVFTFSKSKEELADYVRNFK